MSNGRLRILMDSGVWLDFFVPGHSGSASAVRLVRDAIEAQAELLYPAWMLSDLFYEIRRDAAEWTRAGAGEVSREAAHYCHDYAWGCIADLCELAVAAGLDDADVHATLRYRSLSEDLEDNLLLVAAQRAEVDYLVTADPVLLAKATVVALSPHDMRTVLTAGL